MAQTQLFASLKEHPKLSETREFKIAVGLEDKYSTLKTFTEQKLQKIGFAWSYQTLMCGMRIK